MSDEPHPLLAIWRAHVERAVRARAAATKARLADEARARRARRAAPKGEGGGPQREGYPLAKRDT